MKFGKALLNNQIPEWSRNYLNYKAIKKSINVATHNLPPPPETITALFFQLDRELEKVNTFYAYKQSQIDRRLWILSEKYQQHNTLLTAEENDNDSISGSSIHDITEELISALKETRAQLSKLIRFAELNTKAFKKILKKLDKKLGLDTQFVYWETKVEVLPFSNHISLRNEMDKLAQWINNLSVNSEKRTLELNHQNPSSISISLSLPSKISRFNNLSEIQNQQFAQAIEKDDIETLSSLLHLLDTTATKTPHDLNMTRYGLLELATQKGSVQTIIFLIKSGVDPLLYHDINDRNTLHKLSIRADKLDDFAINGIKKLLELAPGLTVQTDFAGRRPLHYAAECEKPAMVKLLLEHAIQHGDYDVNKIGFADPQWQDREGHNPLFVSIINARPDTVRIMIEIGNIQNIDDIITVSTADHTSEESVEKEKPDFTLSSHHPSSIAMAVELKNVPLLKLLIEKGASVDIADENGETALILAVLNGFTEGVRLLLDIGHASINHTEKINGATPLIVAAIEGNKEIVQLLLDGKADKNIKDSNGWTAYEHAVFRGHLEIGRKTKADIISKPIKPMTDGSKSPPTGRAKSLARPERLYGHKYLTDQSMIIITLGSNDVRNILSTCFLNLREPLAEDQRLSIAISATNATGEFPILDLPPNNQHHLLHPEPIVLFATKPEEVVVRFDLVETFSSSPKESILARGTALLSGDLIFTKTKAFKGSAIGNASLRGQQIVPLVRSSTLECVGTLGFEYFVITPFAHSRMTVGDRYTYYKSVDTKVIGHRGSGMNKKGSRLQVGENTVLSFITAASLGAEYVEFDVQLTKDLVPVIYHDWTVTETGYDIPLNAISVEQFLNLRPSGHIKEYHMGISNAGQGEIISTINKPADESFDDHSSTYSPPNNKRVNRSHSVSSIEGTHRVFRSDDSNRLALTRTDKLGKVKGNGPNTIQAPFTTLAETLKHVPKSAGCNIEVKYPMVDEAEDDELHQFQELNIFVDTILECVYNNTEEDRRIIFSSFHPEICLALNLKQPNYPVFFLTDAGTFPMADVRCDSLQSAIRFAKQADLLGIVAASEPIIEAPRMVSVIKETGLLLFTYGVLNNEVQHAKTQKEYGVDAIIVDSVLAVRNGLRED